MSEYTSELVASLRDGYSAVAAESYEARTEFVRAWAEDHGFSTRSVVAKLSREGVYIPRPASASTSAKKADIVAAIAATMDVSVESLVGLEKAHKSTLQKILTALRG